MTYYAHSHGLDKANWQTLKEHLENTAQLASSLGQDLGLSQFAYFAALFHDLGKYSQAFQRRLCGANIRVDHLSAGAQKIVELFSQSPQQKVIAKILAFCISGHHGGLLDYGSEIDCEGESTLSGRLKKKLHDYDYDHFLNEVDLTGLQLPNQLPIRPIKDHFGFSLAFFTRMLFSVLVDADYLETEAFVHRGMSPRGQYLDIPQLSDRFNNYLKRFQNPSNLINEKRNDILNACLAKAAEKPGLFTLTVPTGGGKTFSSMAFALNHALIHQMKRIIYVIPYTSIIEQNAAEFKACLGYQNVLEHHSNFDWSPRYTDNDTLEKLKLAAENWDIPIVVTTNVQFFESLFSNRPSRCRKLHNIAKSVIILDEAQMLPRDYIKPCFYAIYELVRNYSASVVFCTATQPGIQRFLPQGFLPQEPQELAPDPQSLFNFFKRVRVVNVGPLPDDELVQKLNGHHQVLCIVNTRRHAKGLFDSLAKGGRFHLSTLMCPVHRKKAITKIKKCLKQGRVCRVVSTQILEAGIDIDFPVGYRAISGLDSIVQAAGRVNREAKHKMGDLYVFEPVSSYVKRTPAYIKQGVEVARSILRRYVHDPICLESIEHFYRVIYDLHDESAFDVKGIMDYLDKDIYSLNFEFKTAAEQFKFIEEATMPVIIPFDQHANSIIEKIQNKQYSSIHARELQVYTVNIYEKEFQALQRKGVVKIYGDSYPVLTDRKFYDRDTGLKIPEVEGGEAIFFDG